MTDYQRVIWQHQFQNHSRGISYLLPDALPTFARVIWEEPLLTPAGRQKKALGSEGKLFVMGEGGYESRLTSKIAYCPNRRNIRSQKILKQLCTYLPLMSEDQLKAPLYNGKSDTELYDKL